MCWAGTNSHDLPYEFVNGVLNDNSGNRLRNYYYYYYYYCCCCCCCSYEFVNVVNDNSGNRLKKLLLLLLLLLLLPPPPPLIIIIIIIIMTKPLCDDSTRNADLNNAYRTFSFFNCQLLHHLLNTPSNTTECGFSEMIHYCPKQYV